CRGGRDVGQASSKLARCARSHEKEPGVSYGDSSNCCTFALTKRFKLTKLPCHTFCKRRKSCATTTSPLNSGVRHTRTTDRGNYGTATYLRWIALGGHRTGRSSEWRSGISGWCALGSLLRSPATGRV